MAATNYTPIQLYRTTTASAVPSAANLAAGELAINTTDEKIFFKNTSGTVVSISTAVSGGTVTSVAASGGTTGLTFSGSPITTSGTLTLSGTLNVANGGTGAATLTGYVKGNGTSAMTASASIPVADVTGALSTTTAAATYAPLVSPTFTGTVTTAIADLLASVRGSVTAVSASAVDCSLGNYFTKTASGALTWTFTNVPSTRTYIFGLQLTNGGTGTQSWPASVVWDGGTAPTLQASGTDILVFTTSDSGTTWRGVRGWKQA